MLTIGHEITKEASIYLRLTGQLVTGEDMDTGYILQRAARTAGAFAVTQADRDQVAWWVAQIAELRKQQPEAPEPAALEETHHGLAPTGTDCR